MICTQCATAAGQHADRDAHCTDPGCTCGHRVDKYRGAPLLAAMRTAITGVKAAIEATPEQFALVPSPAEPDAGPPATP